MSSDDAQMARKLRELRLARGLPQGEVAKRLGISPAYLSLIEKGKRALKLPLLLSALTLYEEPVEQFMKSLGDAHVDERLAHLLDEPLMRSLDLREDDLAALGAEPRLASTVTALFQLYKNTRHQLDQLLTAAARRGDDGAGSLRFDYSPYDEVADFLERHDNYFPSLEERAEALRRDAGLSDRTSSAELTRLLREQLGIDVVSAPPSEGSSVIRRYDPGRARLMVSPHLSEQRLRFQLAVSVALVISDREPLAAPLIADAHGTHVETSHLVAIHLANYFAGALLLPYGAFFREAQHVRYDVERLAERFESSYETVAHRLCNLSDPARRGLPMHFLRVDAAGNLSKRYSGDGIRLSHHEGSCPKLAVHLAFLTPSLLRRQYNRYPDGATFFCFAKVVTDPSGGSLARGTAYSIGLGTHAENAKHMAYADDMPFVDPARQATPVGTTCRFCERTDCNMRSAPSYRFALEVDQRLKKENFFSPLVRSDAAALSSDEPGEPP